MKNLSREVRTGELSEKTSEWHGRTVEETRVEVAYLGWWAVRDRMAYLKMRRMTSSVEYQALKHERRMHAQRCWEVIEEIDRRVEERFWP